MKWENEPATASQLNRMMELAGNPEITEAERNWVRAQVRAAENGAPLTAERAFEIIKNIGYAIHSRRAGKEDPAQAKLPFKRRGDAP